MSPVTEEQRSEILKLLQDGLSRKEISTKLRVSPKAEDYLLLEYLNKVGGIVFAEVTLGPGGVHKLPSGSPRRIDAVRIPISGHKEILTFRKNKESGKRFEKYVEKKKVARKKVEVIEAKQKLNRLVIGQAIVGADLLDIYYQPFLIKQVILYEIGDPLLEMICERRGIKVWKPGD